MANSKRKLLLETNKACSLEKFSSELWERALKHPKRPLEQALERAFRLEFQRRAIPEKDQTAFFDRLILQTSHHLTPSLGPSFLGIDLLSLSGLKAEEAYFVGTYTALPIQNTAWSGSLSFFELELAELLPLGDFQTKAAKSLATSLTQGAKEKKIHLVPAKEQSQVLFSYRTTEGTESNFGQLLPSVRHSLPTLQAEGAYKDWALACLTKIQTTIFERPRCYYFDLNQVVLDYLLLCFQDPAHPWSKLLANPQAWQNLPKSLQELTWFVTSSSPTSTLSSAAKKLSKWTLADLPWHDLESARALLAEQTIVPSLFLVFASLAFLNSLYLFGSFAQYDYLDSFVDYAKDLWPKLDLPVFNQDADFHGFSYARIPEGYTRFSLDYFIRQQPLTIKPFQKIPMEQFWQVLLQAEI